LVAAVMKDLLLCKALLQTIFFFKVSYFGVGKTLMYGVSMQFADL